MSQQLQQTMQATQHLSPAEQLELIKFMLAELAKQSKQRLDPIFQFLRDLLYPPSLATSQNNLEALLAQVTQDNLHHEIETGLAIGNEAW